MICLSRADCNRLVFDGGSSEALDIVEKLVTERNMMQRPYAPKHFRWLNPTLNFRNRHNFSSDFFYGKMGGI